MHLHHVFLFLYHLAMKRFHDNFYSTLHYDDGEFHSLTHVKHYSASIGHFKVLDY